MAKQVTYTDIANTRAKAEALETVNAYMSKRRDARSTMKQVDEGYKKIEDWTDDKGDYHVTYGLFDDTTGKWSNLTTETYEGISKPAEPKKVEPEKSIEGARQLWNIYNRNEEFEDRLTGYESIEDMDPTAKDAALDDLYRDATANVTKDDKAKSLTIEGLRTGIGLYPNLPPSYKARLDEIDTQVKAGTANINSQEVQAALGDLQKDYQGWKKPSPDDKAGPITINNLRNLANLRNVSDVFTPQIARLAESNLDVGGFAWQEAAKDIKKDITNWSEKTKTEPTLHNINTLQTGVESMPEGPAKKTATKLIGLMGNIEDKKSKEYASYGTRVATLIGQTPKASSTKADLDIKNVRTMIENTFDPQDDGYKEAMAYLKSAENLPEGSASRKKRLEQAVAVKLNIKTPDPDKDHIPDFDAEKGRLKTKMVAQGRLANRAADAVVDPDTKKVLKKAKKGWGRLSKQDFIITDEMKNTHRQMREAELAKDLAEEDIAYEGQVVHKPEQIRLESQYGIKGIEDSKFYKDNIENSVVQYLKANPTNTKEQNDAAIKTIIFNFVKTRQDQFGATKFKDMYYTLLIDIEPDRHEFDRIKNMFEGFGMALEPNMSRPTN